jgi:hypothetical protein
MRYGDYQLLLPRVSECQDMPASMHHISMPPVNMAAGPTNVAKTNGGMWSFLTIH